MTAAVDIMHQLGSSSKLAHRRLAMLPLRGDGAAFTEVQGRQPGDSTTPIELSDLISSIDTVGVLQPLLVEEILQPPDPPRYRLVTGERRLRALRWGAVHRPESPHFAEAPAVICTGPLSEAERRTWQLVENLAREDLQPGELASALLLERCAMLASRLLSAGKPVPAEVMAMDDAVSRWRELERIRGSDVEPAAPWPDVIRRLGLQLTPRKARELVRAFAALPREISEEMDEQKITLNTRITFAALRAGRAQAADDIWAAIKDRARPALLSRTVQTSGADPSLSATDAVDRAESERDQAAAARVAGLRRPEPPTAAPTDTEASVEREQADPSDALDALRRLAAELRSGKTLSPYDRGSVKLLVGEIEALIGRA